MVSDHDSPLVDEAPWYVTRDRLTDAEFTLIEEYMNGTFDPNHPQKADRYLRMMYQEWRATQWERNEAQDKLQTNPPAIINSPQWIPVEEKLPEQGSLLLVHCQSLKAVLPAYFQLSFEPIFTDLGQNAFDEGDITHWMPMPTKPVIDLAPTTGALLNTSAHGERQREKQRQRDAKE